MMGKKDGVCYKYGSQSSVRDGLSMTLKEISVQMSDEAERLRLCAVLTCVVSVTFEIFIGVAAFVCAAVTDSSAGYAFALDCVLDVIAATFVLWRFYGTSATYSSTKEDIACLSLGILFCLAAVGIICKSIYDIASRTIPQRLMYVFILAGVGGVTNTILAVVMYLLGKKMKSQSMLLEAMNTFLSAVLGLMLAISDGLYFYISSAWVIDPITSLVVSLVLLISGLKVLYKRRKHEEKTSLLDASNV